MDGKITLLNGDFDEEIYMIQPEGCVIPGQENKVCKPLKSLYGLTQVPKQWYEKFNRMLFDGGVLAIHSLTLSSNTLSY